MTALRRLIASQRWLAAWLVAATLAVRVLVPAGYMPARPGSLTLMICSGHMAAPTMSAPMAGMHHQGHGQPAGGEDKADQPCAFAGVAMPSLAAVDQPPVPAPASPAVAIVSGQLVDARAPPVSGFLRPPLRGPPSLG